MFAGVQLRGKPGILAALAGAMLIAGAAHAAAAVVLPAEPTRSEYVDAVEPICQANTEANKRILKGARDKVKRGKMPAAGGQFIRASEAFEKTIKQIKAVTRPPADDARLVKWFGFLETVKKNLHKIGDALKQRNRVKANHEAIRAERSANAANNVSSIFPFHYCKLSPSRFSGT
jgi:hypothetical protein